jgi:ribonuclease HII
VGARWRPYERDLRRAGHLFVAGLDEVGRGPLAGPVVACAVIMPADTRRIAGVNDSKALSAAERERLTIAIRAHAVAVGVGAASVREIDRYNILQATIRAMRRAVGRLTPPASHVVVDGNPVPTLGWEHTAVVKGDATCYSVACASIVAKVVRDALMARLALRYPAYGWERNAGYGTAVHVAALHAHGLTPHHRRSFAPVRQLDLL